MTPEKIRSTYRIANGLIRNPGKFENEPEWVPYYWDLAMEGEGEDVYEENEEADDLDPMELSYTEFVVDSEEEQAFGIPCGSKVRVWEDAQGFVIGELIES